MSFQLTANSVLTVCLTSGGKREEVQRIYEDVDFMRRRLVESEERYELLLSVGLLQCRDQTGIAVKRHLLTAPAEISLDAARGVLTVAPAASFEKFRIELDMSDLQHQARLDGNGVEDRLEELDIEAWNKEPEERHGSRNS